MIKNKKDQGIDLSKYDDDSGISLAKINFGLWLSEKRKNISKLVVIFLVITSVFFFSYSIYSYIHYFLAEDPFSGEIPIVNAPRDQVSELSISATEILRINGYYDFIALLKNPNDRFAARFNYCFLVEDVEITCREGFALPNEEKYLTALNMDVPDSSKTVNLEIRDLNWRRIDNREIPDWQTFLDSRLNFSFTGVRLARSGMPNNQASPLNYLEFTITNNTAYSYHEAPLNLIFYQGSQIVGAHRYVVNNLLTGESRQVRLNWLTSLSSIDKTEITPDINILDDNVYLKYGEITR
jgi:hypothetical protein